MSGGDAGAYDKIWYGCWVCDAELPHRPHSFFRVAHMAAGLLNMHKDGLGAALGIVGVAVPTDEHYDTKKRTPRAMCVSTVNVAPTGSCELLGEAQ